MSAWGVHDELPCGGICPNCPDAVELEDGGPIDIAPATVAALAYVVAGPPGIGASAAPRNVPPPPTRVRPSIALAKKLNMQSTIAIRRTLETF